MEVIGSVFSHCLSDLDIWDREPWQLQCYVVNLGDMQILSYIFYKTPRGFNIRAVDTKWPCLGEDHVCSHFTVTGPLRDADLEET